MTGRSIQGFALLAVLWVLTALTALVSIGLVAAHLGSLTTRNRILLSRAAWAREACTEIALARFAQDSTIRSLDTIDLGRGTWCVVTLEDPSARLDVNNVNREALENIIRETTGTPSIADSIVAVRKHGIIYDLLQVPGMDSATSSRLAPFLTTRGNGAVNVNAAKREVLNALPALSREAVDTLIARQSSGRPITSLQELTAAVTPPGRLKLRHDYERLASIAAVSPSQLIISAEGGVRGTSLVARAKVTATPVGARLAVTRREIE